jgi:hypothetical protein
MDMVDDEWWMKWKFLLYGLSPSVNSIENIAIFLFFFFLFLGPSCVLIFFFLSFLAWTFMCPYFFSIAHVSFVSKAGERPTHIVEYLFVE